jgi:hypothetical protein
VDPQADPDTDKDLDPGLALMIKDCIILQLRKKIFFDQKQKIIYP